MLILATPTQTWAIWKSEPYTRALLTNWVMHAALPSKWGEVDLWRGRGDAWSSRRHTWRTASSLLLVALQPFNQKNPPQTSVVRILDGGGSEMAGEGLDFGVCSQLLRGVMSCPCRSPVNCRGDWRDPILGRVPQQDSK